MKATKKIVGAACALVAAVALSAGSTFAWFAINEDVSATGMSVTANTNVNYLLIGTATTAAAIQGETLNTDITLTNNSESTNGLKPVAHKSTITGIESANTVSNWFYKESNNASTSNTDVSEEKSISSLTGYVLVSTVYLTIQKNTATITNDIVVESVTVTKEGELTDYNAVTVLLASNDGKVVEYKWNPEASGGAKYELSENRTIITSDLTDSTVQQVNIYVYYDGENSTITTNNAKNLAGATISVTFAIGSSDSSTT